MQVYINVCIYSLFSIFQIVISAEEKVENQPERPNSLQIQISKLTASNTHIENRFTMSDLSALLQQYTDCDMLHMNEFPNDTNKMTAIPKIFHDFANTCINPYLCNYAFDLIKGRLPEGFCDKDFRTDAIQTLLHTDTLKRDMRCDIWGLCIDQVWLEFLGVPTSRTRPVPFVESFPLTLWICESSMIPDGVVLPSSQNTTSASLANGSQKQNDIERESRRNRKLLKQYYSEDSSEDSSPVDGEAKIPSLETPANCDTKNMNVQYTSLQIADLNVVAKIGGKIRAQLSNPQYLFLMRLIESVSNLQKQVNTDIDEFYKDQNKSPSLTFSFPLVIPEIEFAMVCPYIAELLPLSNPAELLRSPTPEGGEDKDEFGGREMTVNTELSEGYVEELSVSQGQTSSSLAGSTLLLIPLPV